MTVRGMDVIFDIDGTLMDIDHRRHFVSGDSKDWVSFKEHTIADKPYDDIVDIALMYQEWGANIHLCSGRNESQREVTELQMRICGIQWKTLQMRWENNFEPDDVLKFDMLKQLKDDGYDPTVVFDDRDSVVAMWRANGLKCLQVQPGNF
jgi:FMN phosphatase YigB (HAD superfamily)